MEKSTDRDEKSQQVNFTYFSSSVEVFQTCSSTTKLKLSGSLSRNFMVSEV